MTIDNSTIRKELVTPNYPQSDSSPVKETDLNKIGAEVDVSKDDPKVLRDELKKNADLLKVLQDRGLIAKSDPICKEIESALKDLDRIIAMPADTDAEVI